MSIYIHPNLYDKNSDFGTVLDLQEGVLVQGAPYSVDGNQSEVTYDFNDYFKRLRNMEAMRKALKIPLMSYHAHSFPSRDYDVIGVGKLIAWARKLYEVRFWTVESTALLLICIADPDLSENAGWDFYERGKGIPGHASFHLPAWWEFCQNGTRIPPDWKLQRGTGGHLVTATSPDGRYGLVVGGIG